MHLHIAVIKLTLRTFAMRFAANIAPIIQKRWNGNVNIFVSATGSEAHEVILAGSFGEEIDLTGFSDALAWPDAQESDTLLERRIRAAEKLFELNVEPPVTFALTWKQTGDTLRRAFNEGNGPAFYEVTFDKSRDKIRSHSVSYSVNYPQWIKIRKGDKVSTVKCPGGCLEN